MSKVLNNTGFNYNQAINVLPYKGLYISTSFTALQEKAYDTSRTWDNCYVLIVTEPTSAYWSGIQYDSAKSKVLQLTAAYQTFYEHENDDPAVDYSFGIKHVAGAGFKIYEQSNNARNLKVAIIQLNGAPA